MQRETQRDPDKTELGREKIRNVVQHSNEIKGKHMKHIGLRHHLRSSRGFLTLAVLHRGSRQYASAFQYVDTARCVVLIVTPAMNTRVCLSPAFFDDSPPMRFLPLHGICCQLLHL